MGRLRHLQLLPMIVWAHALVTCLARIFSLDFERSFLSACAFSLLPFFLFADKNHAELPWALCRCTLRHRNHLSVRVDALPLRSNCAGLACGTKRCLRTLFSLKDGRASQHQGCPGFCAFEHDFHDETLLMRVLSPRMQCAC